ncbi:MAG: type I-U CRISPR-associated RAMP protein Csb1/Cas7u [Pseudomonadota bacterium]
MTATHTLTLETVKQAVGGQAAALRCVTEYQPAGGPGDKVFPPTYEGGRYAVETRVLPGGELAECVLLDSVQSQANRMELALLEAHRAQRTRLPLLVARFDQNVLLKKFTVTSLEAPHRAADAIFRDSLYNGVMFRKSEKGRVLDTADIQNATALFGLCPTALLFGLWDSTGPRGGLGAKFQRAIVSEMIGISATQGVKTSSRIDPAQIMLGAGPLYSRPEDSDTAPTWALAAAGGAKKLGKDGKPSEANHGNVTPSITAGGFTIARAQQTTVISLTALRRLRFPLNGAPSSDPNADALARTVLAALGLAAAALTRDESADLRSRCHLIATSAPEWELIGKPGEVPMRFKLSGDAAIALLNEAIEAAKAAGLPWDGEIELQPADDLVELVRRSQQLAASAAGEE